MADATVTRTLPDTLRVEIHERVPLALAELDRLYLMDADGGLIDIYGPRTGDFDLPIVRGLLGVEEESRRDRARRAGALLADLAELGGEISEVYVLPSGDLRVVLRGAGEVLLFGDPPVPPAAGHVPEPAQGPRRARARRRALRPALSGRIYAKRPALPAAVAEPAAQAPAEGARRAPAQRQRRAERGAAALPAVGPPDR